jgi:putative hydrolase of the HAD superfamily
MKKRGPLLPKGILFDMDDTLISFEAVAHPAWLTVCETYAGPSRCEPTRLFDAIEEVRMWYWSDRERNRIGRLDFDKTRREIVGLALGNLGVHNLSLSHEIADAYSAERERLIRFLPGAEETLEHLVGQGVPLALISNGEAGKQRRRVERFRLDRFFKTILIEGEIGHGKPDEIVYRKALTELDLAPDSVWFVGDNLEWDVSGPQKVGIFSVWHDYRARGLPPDSPVRPDRIITSIPQLLEGIISE